MTWLAVSLTCLLFVSCSGERIFVVKAPPGDYVELGQVQGEASGHLGILGTGFYFVPINFNDRTQRAVSRALAEQPEATALMDVTIQEEWMWWVFFTQRTVTVAGTAIRER